MMRSIILLTTINMCLLAQGYVVKRSDDKILQDVINYLVRDFSEVKTTQEHPVNPSFQQQHHHKSNEKKSKEQLNDLKEFLSDGHQTSVSRRELQDVYNFLGSLLKYEKGKDDVNIMEVSEKRRSKENKAVKTKKTSDGSSNVHSNGDQIFQGPNTLNFHGDALSYVGGPSSLNFHGDATSKSHTHKKKENSSTATIHDDATKNVDDNKNTKNSSENNENDAETLLTLVKKLNDALDRRVVD